MSYNDSPNILRFSSFSSAIDSGFWHKLMQIKLDVDKLNEDERKIWGTYSISEPPGLTSRLNVDCSSFNSEFDHPKTVLGAYGVLLNKNTIESFKDSDKVALLAEQGAKLMDVIKSGDAMKNPTLLTKFLMVTFADLKKYHFYYWFAFPALNVSTIEVLKWPEKLENVFSKEQRLSLSRAYFSISDWTQRTAFGIKVAGDAVSFLPLSELESTVLQSSDSETTDGAYLVVADPFPGSENLGWPPRNVLSLLSYQCTSLVRRPLRLVSLRLSLCTSRGCEPCWLPDTSLLLHVVLPPLPLDELHWVGWERNERGRFGPRLADLSSTMDPKKLAEASVDLNLKLMKWRLVPELDLELVKETRCLLLGSGTLGCSVARTLLGWGVRNITLVDNGNVSYSNPVRQSLFTHEDCFAGGKPKAQTAAEALRRIFPGVNSNGVRLTIPMPGHPVGESLLDETLANLRQLEELVENHDAIFLLTDSREARWLPTLLATSRRKLTVCAALGFDTFMVMRHGVGSSEIPSEDSTPDGSTLRSIFIPGHHLGCYFCNDVTAPGNSQLDRTLDQQCTVTRPGLSAVAAGLAVELLVSLLQHPLRGQAPAYCGNPALEHEPTSEETGPLGVIPHSVRGFLSTFQQMLPASPQFLNCIACSPMVVQEYRKNSADFLLKVCNCPNYLEDITGLTQLHKESVNAEVLELSDSEFDDVE